MIVLLKMSKKGINAVLVDQSKFTELPIHIVMVCFKAGGYLDITYSEQGFKGGT